MQHRLLQNATAVTLYFLLHDATGLLEMYLLLQNSSITFLRLKSVSLQRSLYRKLGTNEFS